MIEKINQLIIDNPYWTGTLPRKFNTAIIGREKPLVNPWSNDLLFALAKKENVLGFNIYLGGKNAKVAQDADIFVVPTDVLKLFEAVAETYQHYGLRGSRSKVRLFHLIEKEGMVQLRVWIEKSFGKSLQMTGTLLMSSSHYQRETPLKGGGVASICPSRYGESSSHELYALLSRAKEEEAEIRLGIDQNFHLLVSEVKVSQKSEQIMLLTACAGARYCPLSLWDIKEDVHLLPLEKFKKYNISIGFSGCLKGCGRHYFTDIGLIGLRTNLYGDTEKALRVFMGAVETPEVQPSRMLYYSVPLRKITDLFDVILDDFERSTLTDFETFSYNILNRHDIEFLQLWYIARQLYILDTSIFAWFFDTRKTEENEAKIFISFKEISEYSECESYAALTRELSHLLWDQQEL
jgi:ferredoxin-nitrite reductase